MKLILGFSFVSSVHTRASRRQTPEQFMQQRKTGCQFGQLCQLLVCHVITYITFITNKMTILYPRCICIFVNSTRLFSSRDRHARAFLTTVFFSHYLSIHWNQARRISVGKTSLIYNFQRGKWPFSSQSDGVLSRFLSRIRERYCLYFCKKLINEERYKSIKEQKVRVHILLWE